MEARSHDITLMLAEVGRGDKQVEAQLLPVLYRELHQLAQHRLRGEQKALSLRPTELVNEAYLRLLAKSDQTWENRSHFFATAAKAMRNILVDYIRGKSADKRGGGLVRVELDENTVISSDRFDELLALHESLEKLADVDPDQAKIVELRYFAGFTMQETAVLLKLPLRTVEREWEYARSWLYSELTKPN